MKNKNLYQFHLQLEQMRESVLYFLLKGRIADFYKYNSVKLNSIIDRMRKLQEEYFVMEDERVKMTPLEVTNDVRKEPEPIMQEGKTYEEYLAKYNELMEKDCTIKF